MSVLMEHGQFQTKLKIMEIKKKKVNVTDNDKPLLLVPVGFKVKVSKTSNDNDILNTKLKSSIPNLKSVKNRFPKDIDLKKRKKSKIKDC